LSSEIDFFGYRIGRPIVVASHPRSGTHLTIDLLRKQFAECQGWLHFMETVHHLYFNLDELTKISEREALDCAFSILRRAERPVVKTHTLPQLEEFDGVNRDIATRILSEADILYVVRDGREVLCSMYLWMRQQNPDYDADISEFIRGLATPMWAAEPQQLDRNRVERWVEHVEAWLDLSDGVKLIKFEDLLSSPQRNVASLGNFLELEPLWSRPCLPKKSSVTSRWSDYWRRLTMQYESTAVSGRRPGDSSLSWEEVFSTEDRHFFHKACGELLIRLGYEKNQSWIEAKERKT